MPPKANPVCVDCKKTESLLWRTVENGQICLSCFELRENAAKDKEEENKAAALENTGTEDKTKKPTKDVKDEKREPNVNNSEDKCSRLRKSTRATRFKAKASTSNQSNSSNGGNGEKNNSGGGSSKSQTKGRNRRSLFKRVPFKTPQAQATTHCVESVFHKGSYLQVGDIVSLVDGENNVYYAQIRGLLIDNYAEKSAFLTWLIPTQESPDPKDGFDPATYLIGPDEELSRKLSCLEFVMHAPSNYYLDRTTPFPLPDTMEYDTKPGGYIWTSLSDYQRSKPIEA
ncbi:GATA zinc finger domain-containing protein 1 [Stomoxys calcitrans]|uniref:GATA zinc finger domain-containing protein 1 n=1 Tax=Stomoxys calcitrans TaxID=35570 RepID=UPI0027E2EB72|nr:GATA zinc finger domain-containing protein 1 [Stomoxys calcitrans]